MFRRLYNSILESLISIFLPLSTQAKLAGVSMGKRNFINSHFWSSEPFLITIGDDCQITNGVRMFTHGGGHVLRDVFPTFDSFGKIKIGNRVYIGSCSLIMPGVTIEDNVLVASGSVVTKSIPSNSVVGGNPAKILCSVDEYKERNLEYNIKTKGLSKKNKKRILCSLPENCFVKKTYLSR